MQTQTPEGKRTFFRDIERFDDGTARVRIMSCIISDDDGTISSSRTHADYETLSKGASASATRELKRVQKELAA